MTEDSLLPFDLPAVSRKELSADFTGASTSSGCGLALLRAAQRRLGLAEALAGCIREWRAPAMLVHTLPAMLRLRVFAIACGYEDADDCGALRTDPLFKLAVGRAPKDCRDATAPFRLSSLSYAISVEGNVLADTAGHMQGGFVGPTHRETVGTLDDGTAY